MQVKGNHPLGEILAKKLFSIENVPREEQKRMVKRAISAAIEFYEKSKKSITGELNKCINNNDVKVKDGVVYGIGEKIGEYNKCYDKVMITKRIE